MQHDDSTRPRAVPIRSGVMMLRGYGVRVAVQGRHLTVSDGVGRARRQGRFAKATCRLKRLVLVAQTGYITIEALRWLRDLGAAFVHLDYDGILIGHAVSGLDDARLRRAQALAASTEAGLEMSR